MSVPKSVPPQRPIVQVPHRPVSRHPAETPSKKLGRPVTTGNNHKKKSGPEKGTEALQRRRELMVGPGGNLARSTHVLGVLVERGVITEPQYEAGCRLAYVYQTALQRRPHGAGIAYARLVGSGDEQPFVDPNMSKRPRELPVTLCDAGSDRCLETAVPLAERVKSCKCLLSKITEELNRCNAVLLKVSRRSKECCENVAIFDRPPRWYRRLLNIEKSPYVRRSEQAEMFALIAGLEGLVQEGIG